ncbi:MAG: PKD domain-containing protein, partial [Candidatus Marinimicrobia bacterium]|nr:PKD domain-containing protein [Candidatus Neomarinimicrobiota bacterium]
MKNLIRTTLIVTLILVLSFPLLGIQKEKVSFQMSNIIPTNVNANLEPLPLTISGDTLLNESFEGTVTGWSYIDNDGDGTHWGIYEEYDAPADTFAHTGFRGAAVLYNSAGNDDWFLTPKIGISAGTTVEFSFWAHSYSASYLEDFNVKLSTSGKTISDFTVSLDAVTDVPTEWTQYTYDLSSYAGDSVTIAIQCVSVDEYYLVTDDYLLTASVSNGPIAYYPFNANTEDESGNGSHATNHGAILTTDRHGNQNSAYEFDGVDDYMDLGHIQDGQSDFTWSVWIKTTESTYDSDYFEMPVILGTVQGSADTDDALLGINGGRFAWYDEIDNVSIRNDSINDATWHHLVVTREGSGYLKLFLDNNIVDSLIAGSAGLNSNGLELARANWDDNEFYGGNIDDIYIWNRAITKNEIATLFANYINLQSNFTADVTSGTAPLEVQFTDESTGATTWEWDFDNDGTTDATDQNPSYTYQDAGTYTVSLTISDGTDSDTETKEDYLTVNTPVNSEDYSIPLTADNWGKVFSGSLEVVNDGLKINTTGYRNGNRVFSKQLFNLEDKNIYIKWKKHNAGSYMRGYIGITNTEAAVGDMSNFTADIWLFTRILINSDKTVEAITCTGDYDDASNPGNQIQSLPTTISDEKWYNVQNGNIYFYFDDTQDTSAYLTVGEVKITDCEPIVMGTQTVYDFNNGLIPSEFTTNGAWTIENDESLYIEGNINDSLSFNVENAVAVKIRFKISHNGDDSTPLSETATSLLFSCNNLWAFWTSVYYNGRTSFQSEWCEFTIPANQLGITNFSFLFKTIDGQKLWIDNIEVMNTNIDITADFTANVTTGTAPLEVQFTDESTGATTWEWDFDNDGSTDATDPNPSYIYQDAGNYTVSLTVSDGTTENTKTRDSYITVTEAVGNSSLWTALHPTPTTNTI